LIAATLGLTGCAYSHRQWAVDAQHRGWNTAENAINPWNVSQLHLRFSATLPGTADGAPVTLAGVKTPQGQRDLLFVTTTAGDVVALDAHSGANVWSRSFPAGTCRINNGSTPCYTTSSPAIDPNGAYVYTYGLDGKVHKLEVGTGQEAVDSHWPAVTTIKPFDEKGSSPLVMASARDGTTYLYMTHAGYPGDRGDYQGHLTAINLATGAQHVFNTLCSDMTVHFADLTAPDCAEKQSGVWARASVVYDADLDRIFLTTGNAVYNPAAHHWGDSVLALAPDGTGAFGGPFDAYTPANFQDLDNFDLDLGSTAPAILPVTDTRRVRYLGVQSGKDAQLRLLDLDNLSRENGPGHTGGEFAIVPVPQGGQVLTTPVVWTNPNDGSTWLFVANANGTSAMQVTYDSFGTPSLITKWKIADGGTTPHLANNVLYLALNNRVGAYDPLTGNRIWQDTTLSALHWQSPVVVNGILYIEDGTNHIRAYSL
jgi:outer membrane protein assembly factor BamB